MNEKELIREVFSVTCTLYAKCLLQDKMTSEQAFHYMQQMYASEFGIIPATALLRASVFAYLKEDDKCFEQLEYFLSTLNNNKSILQVSQ